MDILKEFTKKNLFLLLAILFSLFFSQSLFHSGLLPTHDGEYHVIRFFEFDRTLRDGNLYPRWAPDLNNGFGIPLFNYVYPLPNYVASLSHSFGFNFIDSFKINLLLATIIGSIFSFLWSRQFWGKVGGFVTSIFYTFSPYHSLDIFIRGSVGEVWALALFPAFLWSITKFVKNYNRKYFALSSVFLSLIIFSHNILAIMFLFLAISYSIFVFLRSEKKLPLSLLYVFICGIGIASIFWIPAIFERQYVRGLEVYDYSRNFPELYQLLIPTWGSGFSSGSLQNQLSFQIGIANLLAVALGIFISFKKIKNKNLKNKNLLIFFLICFFVVFLLMLRVSSPIWQNFPFMNYFQFPWRFLSLEILFTSFIAGSLIFLPKAKVIVPVLIALSIGLGIGYTKVAYYLERNDSYYTTKSNFIDSTNSPGNAFNTVWFNSSQKKENVKFSLSAQEIKKQEIKSSYYLLQTEIDSPKRVVVNTAYFPNWSVYVNGIRKEVKITENGSFLFDLDRGKHDIKIKLEDTNLRKLATILSIFSLVLLLFARVFFATIKK